MKKLSILLLAVMCASAVAAQKKVGVVVTGKAGVEVREFLGGEMLTAFTHNPDLFIMGEEPLFLQQSDNMSIKDLIEFGKRFDAELICIVEILSDTLIVAKLIDTTSRVFAYERLPNSKCRDPVLSVLSIGDLENIANYISSMLIQQLRSRQ
jgi:hypothetical protein